jgi:nucleotide-binding universal stress UspA family protein
MAFSGCTLQTRRRCAVRILVAVDGSFAADRALDFVAALPWQEGDRVHVVSVIPSHVEIVGGPWAIVAPSSAVGSFADVVRIHQDALTKAGREIRTARADLAIESTLLHGRAASMIVEEARRMPADLIVVGHRGAGRWESMLLGSVSAEVVDHAPCPVLVARDEGLGPVVLADDRSAYARQAESVLLDWPMLAGLAVSVVTVVERGESAEVLGAECDATATRLREAGLDAKAELREGDAARQIIAVADARQANLIVVGTRGQTGLRRLMLGSVARNVLLNAPCSVLVVRGGVGVAAASEDHVEEGELVSPFG